ncbi:DUF6011 domain-containing protein [Jatrophihabitans sp. GAS493]|uniref:DUF6011 domain-containing protein n=1 Tax=Jatrophihabitans sp. GAS493 TaxID=1907575 RepID=UPI0012FD9819|nr:DUF6011 domain-containing protein [Jatrophihabitans sp. GAS493]
MTTAQLLPLAAELKNLANDIRGLPGFESSRVYAELRALVRLVDAARSRADRAAGRSAPSTKSPVHGQRDQGARSWADVRADLVLALNDEWADAIRLVPPAASGAVIAVDRVLDGAGFCVAWVLVRTAEDALRFETTGWTLWRPDWPVETKKQRGRVAATELDAHRLLVATTRHTDIHGFSGLICERLEAALVDAGQTAVTSDECDPVERRRRMLAQDSLERLRRSSGARSQNEVLTHCLNCGRPLTDHESARTGYGPICSARAASAVKLVGRPSGDVKLVLRVAGRPIEQWRRRVTDLARRTAGETNLGAR